MLKVITPPATGDLTVLASLKSELGIATNDQNETLSALIAEASDTIATHCGVPTFGRQTVLQTEYDVYAKRSIVLDLRINLNIISVFADGTPLISGAQYIEDAGVLFRRGARWFTSELKITYEAGYYLLGDLPHDLERCALDLCSHWFHARGRDPALRSERILDVIETRWGPSLATPGSGGIPQDIADRLRPYLGVGLS